MRAVLDTARRAGARDTKVLITGESGVGKDLVAHYIHASSSRARRPFVAVNCAGLAETLLESELFGHVKGSFTGAYRDKPGKLQLADGGTIFLDEVGEMTPRMQGLLLRFLESGEVQPVGGDLAHRPVNARVVAATNRDLTKMTETGQFRLDLMYRIRVVHLHVPPLRQRAEDVRPLLRHFIEKIDPSMTLSESAWRALESYHWPGNVRELQNIVEQLSAGHHPGTIDVVDLPWCSRAAATDQPRHFVERRRRIADELFDRLTAGTASFWTDVYDRFMDRDLTRQDLRDLIARGLAASGGSYRELLRLYGMPREAYKRFLNFIVRHGCAVDFRPFRSTAAAAGAGRGGGCPAPIEQSSP
jgi:transcriptional regulator with PAS, ATPase and Fis domain